MDHRHGRRHRAGTVDWGANMSDGSNPKDAADAKSGSDTESDTDLGAKEPDDGALAAMSQQELLELGSKIDGVQIVHKPPRWPIEGTKAEKRAERSVARWLLLGGGLGFALLLVFLFNLFQGTGTHTTASAVPYSRFIEQNCSGGRSAAGSCLGQMRRSAHSHSHSLGRSSGFFSTR